VAFDDDSTSGDISIFNSDLELVGGPYTYVIDIDFDTDDDDIDAGDVSYTLLLTIGFPDQEEETEEFEEFEQFATLSLSASISDESDEIEEDNSISKGNPYFSSTLDDLSVQVFDQIEITIP
jgi:hypothetical protein